MDPYSICSEGRPGSSSIHTVFTITRKSSTLDFQGYNLQAATTKGAWYRLSSHRLSTERSSLVMGPAATESDPTVRSRVLVKQAEIRTAVDNGGTSTDYRHVCALMRMRKYSTMAS